MKIPLRTFLVGASCGYAILLVAFLAALVCAIVFGVQERQQSDCVHMMTQMEYDEIVGDCVPSHYAFVHDGESHYANPNFAGELADDCSRSFHRELIKSGKTYSRCDDDENGRRKLKEASEVAHYKGAVYASPPFKIDKEREGTECYKMCQDEDGHDVDWWFAYKIPQQYEFYYATSKSSSTWTKGKYTLDKDNSIVARAYQYAMECGGIQYNDGPPAVMGTIAQPGGHMKGVVWENGWLQHSWPETGIYKGKWFPGSIDNGQHFLCVSGGGYYTFYDDIDNAKPHLLKGSKFLKSYAKKPTSTKWTEPKVPYRVFSKKPGDDVDFVQFNLVLSSFLKAESKPADLIYYQTWRKGGEMFTSVNDVQYVCEVKLPGSTKFSTWNDHGKWVIGKDILKKKWVCGLDNNYACTQLNRGGTGLCINDDGLHDLLYNAVKDGKSSYPDECPEDDIDCYKCRFPESCETDKKDCARQDKNLCIP